MIKLSKKQVGANRERDLLVIDCGQLQSVQCCAPPRVVSMTCSKLHPEQLFLLFCVVAPDVQHSPLYI